MPTHEAGGGIRFLIATPSGRLSETTAVIVGPSPTFATVRSHLGTTAKHDVDALAVPKQLFTTSPWTPPALSS
ncbi:hypothetical protein GCM10017771_93770 [Streptomyces capitiformicae]|uniref:Uncharacterized protein n=1 Tax=Streptomyces capitiformicae TaxID=2014920 RepID=A0A918ZVA7_9ACTN|nr:hypothetical protein GCM10017771_93770 [Streptomyces capitiformicae]